MTIAELIERLREFDQSLPVLVKGFDEGGFDDVGTIEPIRAVKVREETSHCAMYEEPADRSWSKNEPLGPAFDALLINF